MGLARHGNDVVAQDNGTAGTIEYQYAGDSTGPSVGTGSVPVNGQLQRFTAYDVFGGYVAAGIGMRNRGYGTINLSGIPDGGRIIAAYLYWDVLASALDDRYAEGVFNGQTITGKLIGMHGDPCWGNSTNYAYREDVTPFVSGNGQYTLSGFASGSTNGSDPWISGSVPPMIEGASLVVVYEATGSPYTQVRLYDGSILSAGSGNAVLTMDGFNVPDDFDQAKTTFLGADGQSAPDGPATFNGTVLPTITWDGNDPQDGPDFSNGNLWDTMTTDVSALLSPGDTQATAQILPGSDCIVWVAQVLSISSDSTEAECSGAKFADLQPLLLIHGWGAGDTIEGDESGFAKLQSRLTDMDYVLNCNLFYATGVRADYGVYVRHFNIASISANLRHAYQTVKEHDPSWEGHFDIIGHSYGGINARFYLESHAYELDQAFEEDGIHIDNLYTLGSPHGGVRLDDELYPGAAWIGWGHIVVDEERVSALQLLAEQMDQYNEQYRQPKDVCYRLIGGDFHQQPGLFDKAPFVWLLYSLVDSPNDIGVSVRSALHLAREDSLRDRYPNVVAYENLDMHGFVESAGLGDVRSYVYPNTTFDTFIVPFLDPGADGCQHAPESQAVTPESSHDTGAQPLLLASGELLPGESVGGSFPVDWADQSAIYAASLDGVVELTLWDGNGTMITEETADSDPNIEYAALDYNSSSLVTYVFSDTVPGSWIYQLHNPTSQAVPYDLYALPETALTMSVSTTHWHRLNTDVEIAAALAAGDAPLTDNTVTATVTRPDGLSEVVELKDDGVAPDAEAGDGVYSGVYSNTDIGGMYHLLAEAAGEYNGLPFLRSAQEMFSVSSEQVLLADSYEVEVIDEDDDGVYDWLNVDVGIEAQTPGQVSLGAILVANDGHQIATASIISPVEAGEQTLALSFSGQEIGESRRHGPYTLTQVILIDDSTLQRLDERMDVLETEPYRYWQFGGAPFLYLPMLSDTP